MYMYMYMYIDIDIDIDILRSSMYYACSILRVTQRITININYNRWDISGTRYQNIIHSVHGTKNPHHTNC